MSGPGNPGGVSGALLWKILPLAARTLPVPRTLSAYGEKRAVNRSTIMQVSPCQDQPSPPAPRRAAALTIAALLRQHQTQLFGYIYSLVRDLDDADDLFQQTSLVLWDKFDQFDCTQELHQLGVRRGAI